MKDETKTTAKEEVSPINDDVRKAYLPEAKESQEVNQTVYWNEAIEILNKNQGLSELFSKFTLTRKP